MRRQTLIVNTANLVTAPALGQPNTAALVAFLGLSTTSFRRLPLNITKFLFCSKPPDNKKPHLQGFLKEVGGLPLFSDDKALAS